MLIDKYLSDAIEVDADAISDGTNVVVAGIMEHIEEAGVHSGDSACSLPPYSLDQKVVEEIRRQMKVLALELGVIGLMNAQFAIKDRHDLCTGGQSSRVAHRAVREQSHRCAAGQAGDEDHGGQEPSGARLDRGP